MKNSRKSLLIQLSSLKSAENVAHRRCHCSSVLLAWPCTFFVVWTRWIVEFQPFTEDKPNCNSLLMTPVSRSIIFHGMYRYFYSRYRNNYWETQICLFTPRLRYIFKLALMFRGNYYFSVLLQKMFLPFFLLKLFILLLTYL